MGWLKKAVSHATHEVDHAAHQVGQAVDRAVQDTADELNRFGHRLANGWHDISDTVVSLIDDNIVGVRGLRGAEKGKLHDVYHHSLPSLDTILICSLISPQGRPFTLPASFIEAVAATLLGNPEAVVIPALIQLIGKRPDIYVIFMGRHGFNDGINCFQNRGFGPGEVLVHEACHVWQGFHNAFTWSYIIDSVYHQAHQKLFGGASPYQYDHAHRKQWIHYNAEQQAQIVEDWYATKIPTLYPYIHDNIRPGHPYATTKL